MTKETHKTGGLLLATTALNLISFNINNVKFSYLVIILIIYYSFACIGSAFPDIDLKSSSISKSHPFLWKTLGKRFRHRGFTHSLLSIFILIICSLFLVKATYENEIILISCCGFIIGYFSHIILDLFNSQGMELLFPFKAKIKVCNIKSATSGETFFHNILKIMLILIIGKLLFKYIN